MLGLPRPDLIRIKRYLLRQQKQVKEQLQEIEKNDPVTASNLSIEVEESGTASWLAEAHGRLTTLKNDLLELSSKITKSLLRLKKGTYGKCEKCRGPIEAARLEAMPTATLCMACSKGKAR